MHGVVVNSGSHLFTCFMYKLCVPATSYMEALSQTGLPLLVMFLCCGCWVMQLPVICDFALQVEHRAVAIILSRQAMTSLALMRAPQPVGVTQLRF